MKTIYIDSDFKCHVVNDGTMTALETDAFDGMCNAVVEGYCYEFTDGQTKIYAWRPHSELDSAQAQYERDMAELAAAYQEGVNSV
jgi:hypothetical protein